MASNERVPLSVRARVGRALRTDGARVVLRMLFERGRERLWNDADHIWLELVPGDARPRRELPPGLRLVRGSDSHAAMLQSIGSIRTPRALNRLAQGGELWLAMDGSELAFACWILRRLTPTVAGRSGVLRVPRGTASLEDSIASPAYRGRSIAPSVWSLVADRLGEEGIESMFTTVLADNRAVQRALSKVGFRRIGTVRTRRRPWGVRVVVDVGDAPPPSSTSVAGERTRQLARRGGVYAVTPERRSRPG